MEILKKLIGVLLWICGAFFLILVGWNLRAYKARRDAKCAGSTKS
jgi:cytochrome c-type biogenesis protein CcmH/NrfF